MRFSPKSAVSAPKAAGRINGLPANSRASGREFKFPISSPNRELRELYKIVLGVTVVHQSRTTNNRTAPSTYIKDDLTDPVTLAPDPGFFWVDPQSTVVARNVTSSKEFGIGGWTDEQIIRALTQSISAGGHHLALPMSERAPIWAQLSERDQHDLAVYLRSPPPQE